MLPRAFDTNLTSLLKEVPQPRRLAVACSGGVDSIALAHLVSRSAEKAVYIYLDHGQRDDTSSDLVCVKRLAKKNKAELVSQKLALPQNSSEAALRKARYAALTKIASQLGGNPVVLTAHHAQDQLETYLMRLLRGTHPQSLKGIAPLTKLDGLWLARPLLAFWKADLVKYALAEKLEWNEDSTNRSTKFARNRLRHELLPLLEKLRPGSPEKILRFFDEVKKTQLDLPPQEGEGMAKKLAQGDGLPTRQADFPTLKVALDKLLGEQAQRTTQGHWLTLRQLLEERQKTKKGGGPRKVVQFPGGASVLFKGSQLFWQPGFHWDGPALFNPEKP